MGIHLASTPCPASGLRPSVRAAGHPRSPGTSGVILSAAMRDHLRALFISLHVTVVLVLAFPQPGAFMHEKQWRRPDVQAAFGSVSQALGVVGAELSPAEVQAIAWEGGSLWQRGRRRTVKHLQFYVKYCGVKQGWSMFANVPQKSGRLEIEIEQGGVWEPIYISQDPAHDWRGVELRQERLRGYVSDFSWRRRKGTFPRFVEALGLRAAVDFPSATRLRARMRTLHFPDPATLRETGAVRVGEPYFETTVHLSEWR